MLITIEGRMGVGKSLTAVTLALKEQAKTGRKIYSNMELYSAYDCTCGERHREDVTCTKGKVKEFFSVDWESIDLQKFYELTKEKDMFQDLILLLDEAYLFMDSRTSSSKVNRLFNTVLHQTRKRNIDALMSVHSFDRIDKRVRQAVDLRVYPRKLKNHLFRLRIINWRQGTESRMLLEGPKFYPFYDTEEIVRVTGKLYKMNQEDVS